MSTQCDGRSFEMTPSPYQSKLLRLAIAQYRKGRDRHRRAFRQARSTTAATVEIGTALAMVPIFAMVQVSQAAKRRLKQSMTKSRLFGAKGDKTRLLNFSDFDEDALIASGATSFTEMPTAERSMIQTLSAVGDCLSFGQRRLLLKMKGNIRPLKAGALETFTSESKVLAFSQITGVASDLETRSLLLVINYSQVWNGLSADQQRQLQRQIGRFSPSAGMLQVADNGVLTSTKKAPAISKRRNGLTQPFRSFWVEVLRTVAEMKQRYRERAATRLVSSRCQVEGVNFGLRSLPKAFKPAREGRAISKSSVLATVSSGVLSLAAGESEAELNALMTQDTDKVTKQQDQPDYLEADVITVGYIEHPFEKLLKWVDRILAWLETQWVLIKPLIKYRLGR